MIYDCSGGVAPRNRFGTCQITLLSLLKCGMHVGIIHQGCRQRTAGDHHPSLQIGILSV